METNVSEKIVMKFDNENNTLFFGVKENIKYHFILENTDSVGHKVALRYEITDYYDQMAAQGNKEYVLAASSQVADFIEVTVPKNGIYEANLSVSENNQILLQKKVCAAKIIPFPDRKLDTNSFFNIGTHLIGGGRNPPYSLDLIAQMGSKFIRDDFVWTRVEKGKYDFQPYDYETDQCLKRGIYPLYILDYAHDFYDNGDYPTSEEAINAYAKFAAESVRHFQGKIKHWEVWNEYNGGCGMGDHGVGNPLTYALMLKSAYTEMKKVDPTITVIGVCTAGTDLPFLEKVFKELVKHTPDRKLGFMDVVSVHPYRYPSSPEASNLVGELIRASELIKKYGGNQPLWLTEIGWPSHIGSNGVDEKTQANYLTRCYILCRTLDFVKNVGWYDFQNDGYDTNYNEHNFGIITRDFQPKPAYVAYTTLTNKLAGMEFIKKLYPESVVSSSDTVSFEGTQAYLFGSEKKKVLVIWQETGTKIVTLTNIGKSVMITDLMGNEEKISATKEGITVCLTGSPVFLEGEEVGELIRLIQPMCQFEPEVLTAAPGEEYRIKFRHNLPKETLLKMSWQKKNGWLISPQTMEIVDTPETEFSIKLTTNVVQDEHYLDAKLSSGDRILANLIYPVKVTQPCDIKIVPSMGVLGIEPQIIVKVKSNLNSEVGGEVQISVDKLQLVFSDRVKFEVIKPTATQTFVFPVKTDTLLDGNNIYPVETKVLLGKNIVVKTMNINFQPCLHRRKKVSIDGNLDDWELAYSIRIDKKEQVKLITDWAGPEDLSARCYTMWDEENFYFAAIVTDEKFAQPYSDSMVWQGDNIQFAIDIYNEKTNSPLAYNYEYGLSRTEKGNQVYRWYAMKGMPTGLVTNAELEVLRQENKTIYEARIPITELQPWKPQIGQTIGFACLINDNDGNNRRGLMEWFSGIATEKNPALFGNLILIP